MSTNQPSGLVAVVTLFVKVVEAFVVIVLLMNVIQFLRDTKECSKAYVTVPVVHASGLKTTALVSKCALPPGEVQMVFPSAGKPMTSAEGAQM